MNEQRKESLKNAREAVTRMQNFPPDSIARVEELGLKYNFKDAVPAAARLVGVYKRLSPDAFGELTSVQLCNIHNRASRDYKYLDNILKFELEGGDNPVNRRNTLVQKLEDAYDSAFADLLLFICHSGTADFKALEGDARAANQKMRDEFGHLQKDMESKGEEAEQILAQIRATAAEQGVSQKAVFFKEEADKHEKWADIWRKRVWVAVGILIVYATLNLITSFIPLPDNVDTVQLALGRTLVFIVLGYALLFCAKNYAAHRHNVVVNRQRQNSLMTYRALVEANKNPENADIVLTQAARFIFTPQDSGYARGGGSEDGGISIETVRRIADDKQGGE